MSNKLQLARPKPDRKKLNHRATVLYIVRRSNKYIGDIPSVVVDRVGRLVRGRGGVSLSEIHGAVAHTLGTTPCCCTAKLNSRAMLQLKASPDVGDFNDE